MKPMLFTGERFIPGQGGAQIAYEHLHRYLFALHWARNRRVLDVAAGSGYGSELIAQVARTVCAIELDGQALSYARSRLSASNVVFARSDVRDLPVRSSSMEFVVALEIIEHVAEQERLISEVARVLQPNGVALFSTPNKTAYTDARSFRNPFHVRELYREELIGLLQAHFRSVHLFAQQIRSGSVILPEESPGQENEIILDVPAAPDRASVAPMYFLALCCKGSVCDSLPATSVYVDPTDYLSEEWCHQVQELNREVEKLGRWGIELETAGRQKDEALAKVLAEVAQRDDTIRGIQEEMAREISRRDESLRGLQRDFEERTGWVKKLEAEMEDRDRRIQKTQDALDQASDRLARIRHAFLYRVLCRLGILPK